MKILAIPSIIASLGVVYLMVASPSTRSYICGRTGAALLDVIGDNPISLTLFDCWLNPYNLRFIR